MYPFPVPTGLSCRRTRLHYKSSHSKKDCLKKKKESYYLEKNFGCPGWWRRDWQWTIFLNSQLNISGNISAEMYFIFRWKEKLSYCFLNSLQDQCLCLCLQSNTERTLDYQDWLDYQDYVRCTCSFCLQWGGTIWAGADPRAAVKRRAWVLKWKTWEFVQTLSCREDRLSWVHCKVPAASIKLLAYLSIHFGVFSVC